MARMKRQTAIAVGLGVWVAALGAAGALTYDLNRTLPSTAVTLPEEPRLAAVQAGPAAQVSEQPSVLYVSTVTVVAQAPRRPSVTREANPQPLAEDISQMHCAGWRELDMGSGRVQVCD